MPSTIDAAALCKMAERGQITGALIDGPLAYDNIISLDAASEKGIISDVAGDADIVVVPNVETGNALAKQLIYLGGALWQMFDGEEDGIAHGAHLIGGISGGLLGFLGARERDRRGVPSIKAPVPEITSPAATAAPRKSQASAARPASPRTKTGP